MLLMTSTTRSGGVGQGRASSARRVSGRSEAQSISATNAPALCFQQVHAQ
jgi:hypothetical protein